MLCNLHLTNITLRNHMSLRHALACATLLISPCRLVFADAQRGTLRSFLLARVCIYAVVALSLTILTGWAGQVSLGQFGLVAVGAICAARLSDWNLALLLPTNTGGYFLKRMQHCFLKKREVASYSRQGACHATPPRMPTPR